MKNLFTKIKNFFLKKKTYELWVSNKKHTFFEQDNNWVRSYLDKEAVLIKKFYSKTLDDASIQMKEYLKSIK